MSELKILEKKIAVLETEIKLKNEIVRSRKRVEIFLLVKKILPP